MDVTVNPFPLVPRAARQSPISLRAEFDTVVQASYLVIAWPSTLHAHVVAGDPTPPHPRGTHFAVRGSTAAKITLDGHDYLLREAHFHAPSEHFIGDDQYDGELHLVHHSPATGRYAVVAILIEHSDQAPCHKELMQFTAMAKAQCDESKAETRRFDPNGLLPEHRSFFRYQGSLTTAPYSESVSWIVYAHPIQSNDPDLADLAQRIDGEARALQNRDQRIIVHCTPHGD